MAETLTTLSTIAYLLAGVFLVLAAVLFFVLKIPRVIDYFTNRSAKKSVRQMTLSTGESRSSAFHTDKINKNRGKLTERVENVTEPLPQMPQPAEKPAAPTTPGNRQEAFRPDEYKGTTLDPGERRNVSLAPETEMLGEYATEILSETIEAVANSRDRVAMKKLDEVILIHTDEVI